MGKNISILAAPDVIDEIPNILKRISRGERIDHYQTKRRTKDGRILSISLTVPPIRNDQGVIIGASKVARDVTGLRRNQSALAAANESLIRSNSDLEHFAYSASHDLQEPLRMIGIYSEMLREKFGGALGAEGDRYIGYIVEGATRMEQLSDLRSFTQASRIDQVPGAALDAEQTLRRTLENLRTAIEASGATITHGELPWVNLHEFQLEQLFQNVIGNAIRYRSQAPPRIHIAAERNGGFWTFSASRQRHRHRPGI